MLCQVAVCAQLAGSLTPVVWGQDSRATITGMVQDQAGAAVPGARIRAVQRSTNIAAETVADHDGYYTLPYLQPGTYDLEVTAPGFSLLRREGVALLVAQKLDLPLQLEPHRHMAGGAERGRQLHAEQPGGGAARQTHY